MKFAARDDCPGIPADKLERLFGCCTRLAHEEKVSGLGLAIMERILRQHGGTIRLSNRLPHGLA